MSSFLKFFDLLGYLTGFLSVADLLQFVRVSPLFNEVGTPVLWMTGVANWRILSPLGTLHRDRGSSVFKAFEPAACSTGSADALERFSELVKLIRIFSTSNYRGHFGITPVALNAFMSYAGVDYAHLFPQLHTFYAIHDSVIPLLTPPSLRNLHMIFTIEAGPVREDIESTVSDIIHRLPHLEEICLVGGQYVLDFEDMVLELFTGLPELVTIYLPRYVLTPIIFHGLRQHPRLENLVVNDIEDLPEESVIGHRMAVQRWTQPRLSLPDHGFQHLANFALSLDLLEDGIDFLCQTGFPGGRLEAFEFFVASPREATGDNVIIFIDTVAELCPHLQDFRLSMYTDSSMPQDVVGIEALGASVLEALTRLVTVKHVRIEHTMPMDLSDSDMAILAPSCLRFVTLSLNPHPLVLGVPQLTMLSVAHLARYCKWINYLGLYLDGRRILDVVDRHDPDHPLFTRCPFIFDVGLSPAPSEPRPEGLIVLAEYLACLIPAGSDVQTGYRESMFDSLEFTPSNGAAHGFVAAADSDMERCHQVWEIVEVLANMMRPLLPPVNATGRR